jgi:hypothetical protein
MSAKKEYTFIKPLSKKPTLPEYTAIKMATLIAKEFIESDVKYAEVIDIGEYKSTTSLSRALGRTLHNKTKGLDPNNKIEVRSDKKQGKVYLLRK